ncbi:TldD/PmbA family protein [Nitrosopumilus sp. K4]|uniref:TldD/PmbA family protein n=1 Tax=Nitrosopumilus sp. K4 TaxID=2795383 RepID=UPI001BAB67AB|nr:TldD/PmbA family protein [Nitrosopumilus sp. K4]QUC63892.1 TldD/PmbA family protein [Nitrosopumilus sp. K4]
MSAFEKASNYCKKFEIDECESVFVKKQITTIRITDSEIAEIKQNFDESFGIRLIHHKKCVSFQTNEQESIEDMIEKALQTTTHLKPLKFWKSLPYKSNHKKIPNTFDNKLYNISGTKAADIAQVMINSAQDKKISTISGSLNIVSENFELSNSNDLNLNDKATYISGIINAETDKGEMPVSGLGQECCRTLDQFSPEKIGQDARKMCIESINPKKCENDTYTVIFEPYSVGELLAFVFAANFNFKTFSEKKSCFSNNINQKIAVDEFSLIDDPHAMQGIGTKSFDDEGVETNSNSFIEKGIFKNTFSNLFDSFKENTQSTGNASRPGSPMGRSSEPIPISAPHNLRVKKGDTSQEEMIKDTKHGLLVGRLWYTYAVNPIKGDFSCTARSGIQIIENGKVNPGRSARIVHNLPTLLQNISSVGNNQKNVIQWASLPSITPSIKVEGIKVIPI